MRRLAFAPTSAPAPASASDPGPCGLPRRAGDREAFSLLEILLAIAILSVALLPLFSLQSRGLDTTRAERVRIAMTLLSNALLERLASGRSHMELDRLLRPDAADPSILRTDDVLVPARANAPLARQLGIDCWAGLIDAHAATIGIELHRRWIPGADLVEVRARWVTDRSGRRIDESYHRTRLLVDGGP